MAISEGFAPLFSPDATVLILGSMPGAASLKAQEYYAHPRNVFWRILYEFAGETSTSFLPENYENKCRLLRHLNVALWDVLMQCERPGSLDADIRPSSEKANDFSILIKSLPGLRRILFNGKKAEQSFHKHVVQTLGSSIATVEMLCLPSTSPANAAVSYQQKREVWHRALSVGS